MISEIHKGPGKAGNSHGNSHGKLMECHCVSEKIRRSPGASVMENRRTGTTGATGATGDGLWVHGKTHRWKPGALVSSHHQGGHFFLSEGLMFLSSQERDLVKSHGFRLPGGLSHKL